MNTLGLAEASENAALGRLFAGGIIPREAYEAALRRTAPGCQTELVTVPTKLYGDLDVMDYRGLWKQYALEYDSRKDAMADAPKVHHDGNMGAWAWCTKGNKQHKRCNYHVDCPVQLRAAKVPGGKWVIEVLDVSHALERKEYRRKNSALTVDQEAMAMSCLDHGLKPDGIRRKANEEAFKMGITEKQPGGNLVGAQLRSVT